MTGNEKAGNDGDKRRDNEDEANQPVECASPPCLMHEVDPAYFGLCDNPPAKATPETKLPDAANVNAGEPAKQPSESREAPVAKRI